MKRSEKGNILLLTIMMLAIISILGVGIMSKALYSQNETMYQIHSQKAYYTAKSAVDAVISCFTNPKSGENPEELIGKIGEGSIVYESGVESPFSVEIKRESLGGEDIVIITGEGTYQGISRTVQASLDRVIEAGSGNGIFGNEVVFGANSMSIQNTSVEGNIYIEPIGEGYEQIDIIDNLNLENVYIKGELLNKTISVERNKNTGIIHVQGSRNGVQINNNEAEEIKVNLIDTGNLTVNGNSIDRDIFIYTHNVLTSSFKLQNNKAERLLMTLDMDKLLNNADIPNEALNNNQIKNMYISNFDRIGNISNTEGNLFTDADVSDICSVEVNLLTPEHIEFLKREPVVNLDGTDISTVLKEKAEWKRPDREADHEFGDIWNGINKEYYYREDNHYIKLVFIESQWFEIHNGSGENTANRYYIPENNQDTIIFIKNSKEGGINTYFNGKSMENIYIYAPNVACNFISEGSKVVFSGSVIAKTIYATGSNITYQFISPPDLSGTGIPGGTGGGEFPIVKYKFNRYQ